MKDPVKTRMTVLLLGCFGLVLAILARATYIQVFRDQRLENMARRQFQSKVLVRPPRGLILDRNGEPLAINIEVRSLAVNPSKVQNKKTLARLLSKAIELPYGKTLEKLQDKKEFAWLKRHLTESDLNHLKKWKLVDSDEDVATGLWMVKEAKRIYPHGELAAHILGSVNLDSDGLEGVELWANSQLRGKVVSVSAVKDALGRPAFIDAVTAEHVKDGESVSLTIDASLQFAVEQELKAAVTKANARGGSAIVMDAVTGEIIAMANQPSFNPNEKGHAPDRRRNRALTDGYEPGSTMKPILLAGALSNGFKLSDRVHGEHGSFVLQGKRISEAEAHEKFEWLTLKKVIQVSSNVGAAKLALKLGADRYMAALKSFGFATKTGTGFPGEISGKMLPRKEWLPLTVANIGFGQSILVTPIQMLRAYAAFLNGGVLVNPSLLKTRLPEQGPVEFPRRVISTKAAEGVLEALQSVTEEGGTGGKARLDGYVVAGKTGTAQVVDSGTGKYSRSKFIASFIGFPVGVDPKLVIFASIEEPRGVYYASETAAPLFREILAAAANRFSLPASPKLIADKGKKQKGAEPLSDKIRSSQAKAVPVKASEVPVENESAAGLKWQGTAPDGSMQWKMPDLRGLTAREAIRILKGHKFQLEIQGNGIINNQMPEHGNALAEGTVIRLTLAEP